MESRTHINTHTHACACTAYYEYGGRVRIARARGREKGRERVGGSERRGEKERQKSRAIICFILPNSSSMQEDVIRDREHRQKETLRNPRLVAFHPC